MCVCVDGVCGCVIVWLCGFVVVWLCGCVVVWLCGCVAVWLCGSVVLWLCGCVVAWLCVCVVVCVCVCGLCCVPVGVFGGFATSWKLQQTFVAHYKSITCVFSGSWSVGCCVVVGCGVVWVCCGMLCCVV